MSTAAATAKVNAAIQAAKGALNTGLVSQAANPFYGGQAAAASQYPTAGTGGVTPISVPPSGW